MFMSKFRQVKSVPVLATLLQSFDIVPASDGQLPDTDPRSYNPGIGLRVKNHLCRAVARM